MNYSKGEEKRQAKQVQTQHERGKKEERRRGRKDKANVEGEGERRRQTVKECVQRATDTALYSAQSQPYHKLVAPGYHSDSHFFRVS